MEELITYALVVAGIGLITVYYFLSKPKGRYPSGPRPWPIVGNLLALRSQTFREFVEDQVKVYGPIVAVKMGPLPMVTLNDYDSFKEAFVKKGGDFAGRTAFKSTEFVTQGGKDVAFHDYDDKFKVLRKMMSSAIREFLSGARLEENLLFCGNQLVESLDAKSGQVFDVKDAYNLYVYNVLGSACFNTRYEQDDPTLNRLINVFYRLSQCVGGGFLADVWGPLKVLERHKWAVAEEVMKVLIDDIIEPQLKEHEDTYDEGNLRDLTDYFIREFTNLKKSDESCDWIDREYIMQAISDVVTAGSDTTRETLYWWTLFMAAHPDIQEKAFKEVASQIGDKFPSKNDMKDLPYLEAVIQESMRCGVVAPLLIPHKTTCDTTVGGYDIPAGTTVIANIGAIMEDPKLWRDPQKFNPQRFIDKEDMLEAYVPFGAGKRSCVGQVMARMEVTLAAAMLLQRFRFSLPEGVQPDFKGVEAVTGTFAKSFEVKVTSR